MESGAKLGRYEIRALIGTGGMGEVYLAQDLELDRPVALKVLPAEFCSNVERVARFKQEARAASALNHPNIITIYEIGEADDRLFIATEFINGETVRKKIENGDLSVFDAVSIAEQVASALAVAHEARIIHRDIKPENIMIRRDGYAKILDFGLAKPSISRVASGSSGAEDKTLRMVTTEAGFVMGSVSYMSPEQARGKEVDERTDIWSLGVVLYEMVTGKNPFAGETVSDSLAAVIHVEPEPLGNYVEDAPEDLQWIARRALEKKADDRYQTIKDFALDLKDLRYKFEHGEVAENRTRKFDAYKVKTAAVGRVSTGETKTLIHRTTPSGNPSDERQKKDNKTQVYTAGQLSANPASRSLSRPARFLPLIILALAAVLAVGAWFYNPFSGGGIAPRFESVQISRITENGRSTLPAISPDGKYIAFVNNENGMRSLSVRQLATGSAVQIASPTNLEFLQPTFSPDGNYIYYTQHDKGVGTLYQVPTLGGAPKRIVVDVDTKVSFSPDGKRLAFVRHNVDKGTSAVYLADSDGANPEVLIDSQTTGDMRFSEAVWAPGGEEILVGTHIKVYGDDSSESRILRVSLRDKTHRAFGEKSWIGLGSFSWLPDQSGFYFLAKASAQEPKQIWFLSFPHAEVRQITSDSSGYAMMSMSADGATIVAAKSDIISSLWTFNPQNREMTQIVSENRMMQGAGGLKHLPDGRILLTRNQDNRVNLWTISDDGRGEKVWSATADDEGSNVHPALSPDGKFIVFSSNRLNGWHIWKADLDGTNLVQLTRQPSLGDFRPQVLADNKTVIFERRLDNLMKAKLMKVSIEGGEEQPVFDESQETAAAATSSDMFPNASPDGRRIAFTTHSFDSKKLTFHHALKVGEVKGDAKVAALREAKAENVGWNYRWSKDGKNLLYLGMEGVPNIYELSVDAGKTRPLTNFNSGVILNFDLTADGKRLYVVRGIINSDLILIKDNGANKS
jgi:serine/threonine protein kinase